MLEAMRRLPFIAAMAVLWLLAAISNHPMASRPGATDGRLNRMPEGLLSQ